KQPLGRQISVVARIDGVTRPLTLSYLSPPGPRLTPRSVARHQQPFWASTLALVLVVGICALLVCMSVWVLLRRRPRSGGLAERGRLSAVRGSVRAAVVPQGAVAPSARPVHRSSPVAPRGGGSIHPGRPKPRRGLERGGRGRRRAGAPRIRARPPRREPRAA